MRGHRSWYQATSVSLNTWVGSTIEIVMLELHHVGPIIIRMSILHPVQQQILHGVLSRFSLRFGAGSGIMAVQLYIPAQTLACEPVFCYNILFYVAISEEGVCLMSVLWRHRNPVQKCSTWSVVDKIYGSLEPVLLLLVTLGIWFSTVLDKLLTPTLYVTVRYMVWSRVTNIKHRVLQCIFPCCFKSYVPK